MNVEQINFNIEKNNQLYIVLSSAMINLLSLTIPIVLMQIYDRVIAHASYDSLMWLLFGASLCVIFEGIFRICRMKLTSWIGARFELALGVELYHKMISGNSKDLSLLSEQDLLESFRSIKKVRRFFAGQKVQTLIDIPFVVIFLFVVGLLNIKVMAFTAVMGVGYFIVIWAMKKKLSLMKSNCVTESKRSADFLLEVLTKLHLIKSFSLEERTLRKVESLQLNQSLSEFKINTIMGAPDNIGFFIGQLVLFGSITICATDIASGKMTLGMMTACTLIAGRVVTPLKNILQYWLKGYERRSSLKRILALGGVHVDAKGETIDLPPTFDGKIILQSVSFHYDHITVLEDADLVISKKSMVGIIADDKVGTSTLMRLICGQLFPDSGKIFYDQFEVDKVSIDSISQYVSYVPSEAAFFKGSVLDNITLYDNTKATIALDAAAMLGLDPIISMLPKGYDTQIDSDTAKFLSTGLLQRVSIARALTTRPKVIVFDKTNHSMDSETEKVFHWLLNKLKGKMTIIIVSRKNSLFELCDNIYRLKNGKLLVKRVATHG